MSEKNYEDLKILINKLLDESSKHTLRFNSFPDGSLLIVRYSTDYLTWGAEIENLIINNYGETSSPNNLFLKSKFGQSDGKFDFNFEKEHNFLVASLKSCLKIPIRKKILSLDVQLELNNIFEKFHLIVKQLRKRHNDRPTLDVNDEYDVQDLLHSLLKLYFEDIRAEEWTPSYAGSSSRMDFLLNNEEIVIEVKKTRKGLKDRQLGEQLIVDMEKYRSHPNCKKLICFTYDPDGYINNPAGLQNDLNSSSDDFQVEIIIKP